MTRFKYRLMGALLLMALGAPACSSDAPKEAPAKKQKAKKKSEKPKEEQASIEDQRRAFGVVLPPEVISLKRFDAYARVETKLKLPEVKSFYESKLVDYELIEHHRQIKFIGLRDFMPEIQAMQMAWKAPTTVIIRRRESTVTPEPLPVPERPKVEITVSNAGDRQYGGGRYSKGDPVQLRTADGELLAPGARWGQPYTPPKGSPMDRQRYKSHFGKPFGEWTLQ